MVDVKPATFRCCFTSVTFRSAHLTLGPPLDTARAAGRRRGMGIKIQVRSIENYLANILTVKLVDSITTIVDSFGFSNVYSIRFFWAHATMHRTVSSYCRTNSYAERKLDFLRVIG
jgi:hypothetical protein